VRAVVVAAVLVACGGKGDDRDPCIVKLEPLKQPGAGSACTGVDAVSRAFRACVIAAVDVPGVAACLEPLREATQPRPPADAAVAADGAAPADAAAPATPIDIATLGEIPVAADAKRRTPTDVFAVDAPVDQLVVELADRPWLLAVANGGRVTGRVNAPSRAAAADAIAGRAGMTLPATPPRGGGSRVDLTFAAAPQRDLLRLLADVMRTTVVAPGELKDVDIVARKIPAGAVLAALAELDGRTLTKHGGVTYLVPAGAALPELPSGAGRGKVTLQLLDATAADAMAALRAVTSYTGGACGGAKLELRLRDVPVAEAARAIAVAAGVPLVTDARCPLADDSGDLAGARVIAIARSGDRHAAIVVRGTATKLARVKAELSMDAVMSPLATFDAWVATLGRATAVIRTGGTWSALLETRDRKPTSTAAVRASFLSDPPPPAEIDTTGVAYVMASGNRVLVPLRKL